MRPFKTINLDQILSPSEIERARAIFATYQNERGLRPNPYTPTEPFCTVIVREILTPEKMKHINEVTGQENDARFIGYAIEWCLMQEGRRKPGPRRDKAWVHKAGRRKRA